MTARILIYEDNKDLSNSIKMLFQWQDEYQLIAVMPDAQNVLNDLEEQTPDAVMMDIEMPGITGVAALKKIRTVYPDLPVIMFTVFDDDNNVFEAMRNGANGYILKKDFDQLIPAITDVLNGGAPMTGAIARKVLQLFAHPKATTTSNVVEEAHLTARENDLLELLVKGYSYKMIAAELGISVETVRVHIKKIYKKLEVNSATEAVSKVLRK
ncbi:MAG: response regulator transcription factor [Chitinophagaceae bacterium]|nr:response regulator transcription factor [Chitinophagaceae bacterium]